VFRSALVRPPGHDFAAGISAADLGPPVLALALRQHAAYCAALVDCGLELLRLPSDDAHPDSTFVEDTAILSAGNALLTRPGAASRRGEVAAIAVALGVQGLLNGGIEAPGTLDGGDVCECEGVVYVGVSARTNAAGADQLEAWLAERGLPLRRIDIRAIPELLHLKSGMSWLGDGRIAIVDDLRAPLAHSGFELVEVGADEAYGANCIRVNDIVLVAAGHPRFERQLAQLGHRTRTLDMSEFRKMDGGLSCLSLRW
jgi:dimethylargininase